MYRFALSPKWIVSHLLVLALIITMINLGLWQLRRLEDRRDFNDRVSERSDEPVVPVLELTDGVTFDTADEVTYRVASASGTYQVDEQVVVRNRSLDGAPGYWVLTPLVLEDGSAVMVNRGWLPLTLVNRGEVSDFDPPSVPVEVWGLVLDSEQRRALQSDDPDDGALTDVSRIDLERLDRQTAAPLLPVLLQLEDQRPPPAGGQGLPAPVGRPRLDEGSHLEYAVQWFVFTAIALGGYPLVLRRVAADRARDELGDDDEPGPRRRRAASVPDWPDEPDPGR